MYFEFAKKSFQQSFIYRGNTIIHIIGSFLYLFVSVSIWTALYAGKHSVAGISLNETITYLIMTRLVSHFVYLNMSGYVTNRVMKGNIAIDFIRPVNLKWCAIFTGIGTRIFAIMFISFPMVIIGSLIWGFVLPTSLFVWISFILSIVFASVIHTSLEYTLGLTSFWTKTNFHVSWVKGSLMTLFSGAAIPLWFYPKTFKMIADILPFKYIIFEPLKIFLGKTTQAETLNILLMQLAWMAALLIIEKIVWHYAKRVVTVQGG